MTSSRVVACDVPATSLLDRRFVATAYFQDAYRAPLGRLHTRVTDVFIGIFAHHPVWMKIPLMVRNWLASLCGLDAPAASEIIRFEVKSSYRVGEKIGVWPIFSLTDNELIAGRDNKHLDFRLSVLKVTDAQVPHVVVSTVCVVHNWFGKAYLFFVVPFHKWGVRLLLSNAISAGRL